LEKRRARAMAAPIGCQRRICRGNRAVHGEKSAKRRGYKGPLGTDVGESELTAFGRDLSKEVNKKKGGGKKSIRGSFKKVKTSGSETDRARTNRTEQTPCGRGMSKSFSGKCEEVIGGMKRGKGGQRFGKNIGCPPWGEWFSSTSQENGSKGDKRRKKGKLSGNATQKKGGRLYRCRKKKKLCDRKTRRASQETCWMRERGWESD